MKYRRLAAYWLLIALCACDTFLSACDSAFLLLSDEFRAAAHMDFAAYDPALPAPRKGPPFTQISQKLYHYLLHGQLRGEALKGASLATRAAVTKLVMDEIAAVYPDFRNYGPIEQGEVRIFHGRFGSFLVLHPNGETYFGVRNPVNGRPVRGKEYEPADMEAFFARHRKVIDEHGKVPNEIELIPLEDYLRGSVENYSS